MVSDQWPLRHDNMITAFMQNLINFLIDFSFSHNQFRSRVEKNMFTTSHLNQKKMLY